MSFLAPSNPTLPGGKDNVQRCHGVISTQDGTGSGAIPPAKRNGRHIPGENTPMVSYIKQTYDGCRVFLQARG